MNKLPLIVGFGGISPAGRSSAHHGFRRLVIDALPESVTEGTYRSLAKLMHQTDPGLPEKREYLRRHTLVRQIEENHFDTLRIPWNRRVQWRPHAGEGMRFHTKTTQLPNPLLPGWTVLHNDGLLAEVRVDVPTELLLPAEMASEVNAAGQLPSGFDPKTLYPARSHPRGLQMTVYGASDAIQSLGFSWDEIRTRVSPDQISVYAGSGMGQLDSLGNGGMMSARMAGKRVSSKNCPFGFAEMPADFINAYILGSLGNTGTSMGACASFLYNLRHAVIDIQSGRARVAIVGNAEAPITAEIIEGYSAMGALATDAGLRGLDGLASNEKPDYRRACRPFSNNVGFTIAESAQFVVLMECSLALELGATIHGAAGDVFVNADGHKKSISSPGVGNYLTMMRAMSFARAIVGEEGLRQRSFVQAHGTGTPQNRVTESHILSETARRFGIENWPVCALKAYLGHSIGAAAGDQLVMTLGTWAYGVIPGIATIDHVAADVHAAHLQISNRHIERGVGALDVAIINAKGFGGNNASCAVLAPHVATRMLEKRYGREAMLVHARHNEKVREASAVYDVRANAGDTQPIYLFDHGVLRGEDLVIDEHGLKVPGYTKAVDLDIASPYPDMI